MLDSHLLSGDGHSCSLDYLMGSMDGSPSEMNKQPLQEYTTMTGVRHYYHSLGFVSHFIYTEIHKLSTAFTTSTLFVVVYTPLPPPQIFEVSV